MPTYNKLDENILYLLRLKALTIDVLKPSIVFASKRDLDNYIEDNKKYETKSYFEELEDDIALSLPERAKKRKACAVKKESVWEVVKGKLGGRKTFSEDDCRFLCDTFGKNDLIELKLNAPHIHFANEEKLAPEEVHEIARIFGKKSWFGLCGRSDTVVVSVTLLKRLYGKINEGPIDDSILDSIALYLCSKNFIDLLKDPELQDITREKLIDKLITSSSEVVVPSKTVVIPNTLRANEKVYISYDEEDKNYIKLNHTKGSDFEVIEATSSRLHSGDIIKVLQFEIGSKFFAEVTSNSNGEQTNMTYQSRPIAKIKVK